MKEYRPKIESRDNDELIEIAHSTDNSWQIDAIDQAKSELKKRGITRQMQLDRLNELKREIEIDTEDYEKGLIDNKQQGYTYIEMIKIFLLAPFILSYRFSISSGLTLSGLKRENYQTKFRQRIILLVTGILFWIMLIIGIFKYSEYKRLKEIDKVDITNWEKNRIK